MRGGGASTSRSTAKKTLFAFLLSALFILVGFFIISDSLYFGRGRQHAFGSTPGSTAVSTNLVVPPGIHQEVVTFLRNVEGTLSGAETLNTATRNVTQLRPIISTTAAQQSIHLLEPFGSAQGTAALANANRVASFSRLRWLPVRLEGGVLTLWSHHRGYREAIFGGTTHNYEDSQIRTELNSDIDLIIAQFPALGDAIVPLGDPRVASHTAQGNAALDATRCPPMSTLAGDRLWIASVREIENSGFWGITNDAGRAQIQLFTPSDTSGGDRTDWAMTRNGNTSATDRVWRIGNSGSLARRWRQTAAHNYWNFNVNFITSVRPAIHLCVDTLLHNRHIVSASFDGTTTGITNPNPALSVTGTDFLAPHPTPPARAFVGRLSTAVPTHNFNLTFDAGAGHFISQVTVNIGGGVTAAPQVIELTPLPVPGSFVNIMQGGVSVGRVRAFFNQDINTARTVVLEVENLAARLNAVGTVQFQPSDIASLSSLQIFAAGSVLDLSPAFSPEVFMYTVPAVSPATSSAILTIETECPSATFEIRNGDTVAPATGSIGLNPGDNLLEVIVTAQDGTTTKTYFIGVERVQLSDDAGSVINLRNIQNMPIPLSAETATSFSATVSHGTTNIIVQVDTACAAATVISGAGSWALNVGDNTRTIIVEAENGSRRTTTITVTRAEDSDLTIPGLFAIAVVDADTNVNFRLDPIFTQGETKYTVEIPFTTNRINIFADPLAAGGSVTGTGEHDITQTTSIFELYVTAPEGGATRTYFITVIQTEANSGTELSNLSVSGVTFNIPFSSANRGPYIATAPNATTAVIVNATPSETTSTVSNTGTWSGLVVGLNVRTLTVTAQNGDTGDYIIHVFRQPENDPTDSTLISLSVRGHTLSPAFRPDELNYSVSVPNTSASVEILAVTTMSAATAVLQTPSGPFSGDAWEVSLVVGQNNFQIIVSSEDGSTNTTYNLIIVRAAASTDSSLRNVWFNNIGFTFVPGQTTNDITVAFPVASTIISASYEPWATVTGLGIRALSVGLNSIEITVTAQAGGAPAVYSFNIYREEGVMPPCCCEGVPVCLQVLIDALEEVLPLFSEYSANYTQLSMAIVRVELDRGIDVLNNTEATQNQVNTQAARILSAWAARQSKGITPPTGVNRDRLQALLNIAIPHMAEHGTRYSNITALAVHEAIRVGLLTMDNNLATQVQVNFAADSLERALEGLRLGPIFPPGIDRAALRTLRNTVISHMNHPGNMGRYTQSSVFIIDGALAISNIWYFNAAATQAQINTAYAQLRAAFDARVLDGGIIDPTVDRDALRELIDRARTRLNEYPTRYTSESVNSLIDELSRADVIYEDAAATQAQIDVAYQNLRAAYNGLTVRGNGGNDNNGGPVGGVWGRLANIWSGLPWVLFVALPILLLLIILAIVLGVVLTRRRRAEEEELDENGVPVYKARLSELRMKARDAVNKAFSELKYAGECVTYCDSYYTQESEKTAMDQLVITDKAMITAEECVMAYLAEKKAQEGKNQKGKKKKKRAETSA